MADSEILKILIGRGMCTEPWCRAQVYSMRERQIINSTHSIPVILRVTTDCY